MIPRSLFRVFRAGSRPRRAFSLVELAIVVAVLGILAAVIIDAGLREWRREQVNGVVIDLAGWLETVRRTAIKGYSCQVTIRGGMLAGGDQLAQADACGTLPSLRLPALTDRQRFVVQPVAGTVFSFTPAGTLFPAPEPSAPIVVRVSLQDAPETWRCLQLEGLIGVITLGRSSSRGGCEVGVEF